MKYLHSKSSYFLPTSYPVHVTTPLTLPMLPSLYELTKVCLKFLEKFCPNLGTAFQRVSKPCIKLSVFEIIASYVSCNIYQPTHPECAYFLSTPPPTIRACVLSRRPQINASNIQLDTYDLYKISGLNPGPTFCSS